jgi:hypothetical protein
LIVAELEEVSRSDWCDFVEQFKNNVSAHSLVLDAHACILASLRIVDSFLESLLSDSDVLIHAVGVLETVLIQSPLDKLICVADVVAVVEVNQGVGFRVLVEDALHAVGGLLQELGPLGLKELEALGLELLWVKRFELASDSDGAVEKGVVDHAGYGYFRRHFLNYSY